MAIEIPKPDEILPDPEKEIVRGMIRAPDLLNLVATNVAPDKPELGDIRLADGTNWNPGAGIGFYGYHSGAWNKLG